MDELIADRGPALLDLYDRLEELVPADLADDVATVRDFTSDLSTELENTEPTLESINAVFEEASGAGGTEAASATLAIDEYSRETCDVVIAD